MPTRIAVIQGHPDPDRSRFCRALADAYAQGAELAGHQIRRIEVADLDFPHCAARRPSRAARSRTPSGSARRR